MHCVCKGAQLAHWLCRGLWQLPAWFDCPAVGPNGYVVLGPQLQSLLLCKLEVLQLPKLADPMQFAAQLLSALLLHHTGQGLRPRLHWWEGHQVKPAFLRGISQSNLPSSPRGQGRMVYSIAIAKVHAELSCSGALASARWQHKGWDSLIQHFLEEEEEKGSIRSIWAPYASSFC